MGRGDGLAGSRGHGGGGFVFARGGMGFCVRAFAGGQTFDARTTGGGDGLAGSWVGGNGIRAGGIGFTGGGMGRRGMGGAKGEAIREDNGREGMGWRVRGGRLFARTTVSVTTEPVSRDGSPHARGHGGGRGKRGGGGKRDGFLRSRGRLFAGITGGEGWVGGFARTTGWGAFVFVGGGMGFGIRVREGGGMGWVPACVRTREGVVGERGGMGPRMREDNGGGKGGEDTGWVGGFVFTRGEGWDGFLHSRGHGRGGG